MDLDALLDEAVPPTTTVRLCLRGDLLDEYRRLRERQAAADAAAKRTGAESLGGSAPDPRLAELAAQIAARTITVTLAAMPKPDWAPFVASHAPRQGVDRDAMTGFNVDTLFVALVRRCWAAPEITDEQFDRLVKSVSAAQFDDLANEAWKLNRDTVDVPFSPADSTSPRS